jgi:outer membrane lipoprotein-sorting protein
MNLDFIKFKSKIYSMKKLTLLTAFIGFAICSFAQSADEIVSKYFENIGGLDKINAIVSVQMKAKVDYGGMSIPIDMVNLKDGKMMMKINFQGKEITQMAFDGETSWSTNFMTMKAEKDESENTENVKRAALDFISPFVDYKNKGYSVELLPNETIEGVECFKIKLTKKTILSEEKEIPNIEYYYFDKENYVPIVVEQEIPSGEMKGQISQTLYSDYQEVDGLMFAFSMTQKLKDGQGQTIVFESIALNNKFENSIFKFPGE